MASLYKTQKTKKKSLNCRNGPWQSGANEWRHERAGVVSVSATANCAPSAIFIGGEGAAFRRCGRTRVYLERCKLGGILWENLIENRGEEEVNLTFWASNYFKIQDKQKVVSWF